MNLQISNMLLLCGIIVWKVQVISNYPLNVYVMQNQQDKYCLLYYSRTYGECNHLNCEPETEDLMMFYCFRPVDGDNLTESFDSPYGPHPNFTFADLRERNGTSQMLLSWSSSIKMAEQYQIYLNNYPHSNSSTDDDIVFYNCTFPRFGPFCRLQFDEQECEYLNNEDQKIESFSDLVNCIFTWKNPASDIVEMTCYRHLTCQSLLSCLDWRQICDRKQDCLDGEDEKDCWQLELHHCNDNEYRCSNGQCVPIEYIRYNSKNPECMDRTDQLRIHISNDGCYQNNDFRFEERGCRPGENEFPCGDGQCISELGKCNNGRHRLLTDNFCANITLHSIEFYEDTHDHTCVLFCSKTNYAKHNHTKLYTFRQLPLLLGHVRVIFPNRRSYASDIFSPNYVCYNGPLCPHFPPSTALFHNLTCHQFSDLRIQPAGLYSQQQKLVNDIKTLFRGCLVTINETFNCNYSVMYQCRNSTKCISKYQLMDGMEDCPHHDDETYNQSCSLNDVRQRFKCRNEHSERCFSYLAMVNGKEDCSYGEDEYDKDKFLWATSISFVNTCDGNTDLLPLSIDGQNETDETECDDWQCNNTYSRCDNYWLCKNGADEIGCLPSNCSEQYHNCIFRNDTSKISCLPIILAGNDIDDCLGGTDEQTKYRIDHLQGERHTFTQMFHCHNHTKLISRRELCNNKTDCPFNDDEVFCELSAYPGMSKCSLPDKYQTDVERFLCRLISDGMTDNIIYFRLPNVPTYPSQILATNGGSKALSIQRKNRFLAEKEQTIKDLSSDVDWQCNRGMPIRLQKTENISILACLCPPSYYGDKCQYQNQRISLTIRVRVAAEWRNTFTFLITLVDADKYIESYYNFEFQSVRDCRVQFHVYLLYSTRPKNISKSYSIQIDAFDKLTLLDRASWIFPLRFPFLPVQRLSILLRVPFSNEIFLQSKCSPTCVHGQCFRYVNDRNSIFCRCQRGWTGIRCDIEYECKCASNSLCINNFICLCPPGRFGAQCHLYATSCNSKLCSNGELYTSVHGHYLPCTENSSMCTCTENDVREQYEYQRKQTRIDISFDQTITVPSSILVHFIAVQNHIERVPNRTTIAKKLQFDQYQLTVYTSAEFNIAIAQIDYQYYLIILRQQRITFANIVTKLNPNYRCRSLGEVFDKKFLEKHPLKRIKSYHLPCQKHYELICFHDDVHFCLCTLDRSANCFEFDHNMTYDCDQQQYCGDHGHCFQDDLICPTSSFCTCDQCYFGSKCQFSTKRSTISLNIILGYHFRSETTLNQQPIIIKFTIGLTLFIFIIGIINSFLSFQAFRGKEAQSVGCGLYLFASTFVSMITVLILLFKCTFLVASDIGWIPNHLFTQIHCRSMDFLLRSLLSTNDWLSVCVAIERVINVSRGVNFNKEKSKQIAKRMIAAVVLCTFGSYIYDPIHRHVVDDREEQRTWCLNEYSLIWQIIDYFVNIFHFFVSFAINGISAVLIIIIAARTRSKCQKKKSFRQHIREQLHHHRHLLISPLILVVLALSRLILSFLSGCMGSPRESWLYLIGYFVAFIPSIVTFIVFVLPSDVYKKQFIQSMKEFCHLR